MQKAASALRSNDERVKAALHPEDFTKQYPQVVFVIVKTDTQETMSYQNGELVDVCFQLDKDNQKALAKLPPIKAHVASLEAAAALIRVETLNKVEDVELPEIEFSSD